MKGGILKTVQYLVQKAEVSQPRHSVCRLTIQQHKCQTKSRRCWIPPPLAQPLMLYCLQQSIYRLEPHLHWTKCLYCDLWLFPLCVGVVVMPSTANPLTLQVSIVAWWRIKEVQIDKYSLLPYQRVDESGARGHSGGGVIGDQLILLWVCPTSVVLPQGATCS